MNKELVREAVAAANGRFTTIGVLLPFGCGACEQRRPVTQLAGGVWVPGRDGRRHHLVCLSCVEEVSKSDPVLTREEAESIVRDRKPRQFESTAAAEAFLVTHLAGMPACFDPTFAAARREQLGLTDRDDYPLTRSEFVWELARIEALAHLARHHPDRRYREAWELYQQHLDEGAGRPSLAGEG